MDQKTPKLILASASPRRLELLGQMNIVPDAIIPADIDETPFQAERPRDYAKRMAGEKLNAIIDQCEGDFCLAADTVVACGRRILGKPEDEHQARDFLKLLSGRRHQVMTSVAIKSDIGQIAERLSISSVKLNRLDLGEIDAYIASQEWQGKAGGYGIQGLAAKHITWINGSYTGIVGLPLFETGQMLKGLGFPTSLA